MIEAGRLLGDLKKLRKMIDADLRNHHAASVARGAIRAEWTAAHEEKRTANTFETFFSGAVDQAAVHWILALVFVRFLEDNDLLNRPYIAGPGERLEIAQLRQRNWFKTRPEDSDVEYLLGVFDDLSALPGLKGLFDPEHNPMFRLPVSGDGAMALFAFFRDRSSESGDLSHDFTDADWTTRFLGDLYQDLSEDARQRYALLQTPEFVESWILSRTLEPALREFGHEELRLIDPTCGSGHFLLGGFARMLEEWRRLAPDMPPAAQAQKALDAVSGVDLNPFAVEIARFRLLIAALKASGETRLSAAPDFRFGLAIGDSLLHGRHFSRRELGGTEEGFRRTLAHHYAAEDTSALDKILGRQYHVVVGNPPYITPKDAAMREAYREIYRSCHGKYGLGAPFIERFFDLAQGTEEQVLAGFVGLIVANSFMKREFGKKLIQEVLPNLDLTHVADCSGAYIPGHGTPTAIMFGRNRIPLEAVVRTVRGVRGEPSTPADPAHGFVWSAVVNQTDLAESNSEFISTEDTPRAALARHPWNMGGGGAAEIQEVIEGSNVTLRAIASEVGITSVNGEDEIYLFEQRRAAERLGIRSLMPLIVGDSVRDYRILSQMSAVWPHDANFEVAPIKEIPDVARHLWAARAVISKRKRFGTPMMDRGLTWYEFQELYPSKLRCPLTIVFAFVATHNHFVLDRGGKVFNRSAPVIKLSASVSESEYLGVLGLLNSSTACFWMKQVSHNKGATVDERGARQRTDPFEDFYEYTSTGLQRFPIVDFRPVDLATALDTAAQYLATRLPATVCLHAIPTREMLNIAHADAGRTQSQMIALQEELDWRSYELYGLLAENLPQFRDPPPLQLGERAFEIVMARRMGASKLETTWFERHGSTPITELPDHWPADYRAVVERRIALIESDPTIGLIERPEYKRRWASLSWEDMEREALKTWLLDRLEDARHWPVDAQIVTAHALADRMRYDADFLSVAELYMGRLNFDLDALVADLVTSESVSFLAALRYSETGLRKRADWEATWDKQRAEDAVDAEFFARRQEFLREAFAQLYVRNDKETAEAYAARMASVLNGADVQQRADAEIGKQAKARKNEVVGDIAVPPKYKNADFRSQGFWRLRGGLDVPKERFVSFPHCSRDADPSLPILWAGFDCLARARALATLYTERKEADGWPPERLTPLLAGVLELTPWLSQWHNDLDADTGLRMGTFFENYISEEARSLGLTLDDLRNWAPPAPVRRLRGRRASA